MPWKLEDAEQKFADLIHAVVEEPQLIYDQNQLVAAVIKADIFQEFLVWQQQSQQPSLGSAFAELRELCLEEKYLLETPPRRDRSNSFTESLHDLPL
ncbi:MAG: prevent-host-death protein [Leptolyngbya sp.]|nr:MAG: prevent-host-death protein [Leptolyngbya sp.]